MGVFQCFMSLVSCDARAGDGRPQPRGRLTFAGFQGAPAVRPRNVWLNTPFRGGLYALAWSTRQEGLLARAKAPGCATLVSEGARPLLARPGRSPAAGQAAPSLLENPTWVFPHRYPGRHFSPNGRQSRLGYSPANTQVGFLGRTAPPANTQVGFPGRGVSPANTQVGFYGKDAKTETRHKEPPCLKARSKVYVILDHTTGHRPRREEAWAS